MSVKTWLIERTPPSVISLLTEKTVPRHKFTFWYIMGGLTGFFFLVQVVTGILLALNYHPSADAAYESVYGIIMNIPHGWLIRSIHSWSANLMIGSLLIHMFSVFLMRAYRKPREMMWLSGVLLLFLVLGFAFTGYLLPWDTTAFFATYIGTEIPKSIPLVGEFSVRLLRGGSEIGTSTIGRMYAIHVIILPLVALLIIAFHLIHNHVSGVSVPIGTPQTGAPIKFFPNFLYRDLFAWCVGLIALLGLALLLPVGLDEKANPFGSAPPGIHPAWYFLPLYQTLRMLPATIFSINSELIVNLFVGIAVVLWLLVPFLDRRAYRGERNKVISIVGIVIAAYLAFTILLTYTS